ncbi:type I-B CRISPR-associated protein Cas8b1/Cst1 [Lactobacillus sp. PSON]|uniref:type I-B CRISPR-associated protein Cas8b1/Cst1 n=1 Tax=Lactobacillus sp. PSON TaxID=3455454 RepID=UPI004042CEA7
MEEVKTNTLKSIKFSTNSWLENAGIVGLTRILSKEDYKINETALIVKSTALNSFADRYFKYFINKYGKYTRFQRILSMELVLKTWQDNDYEEFNQENLNQLTDWFDNTLKYSINSKSYVKVIKFINSDFDVINKTKACSKLIKTLKKKNELTKRYDETLNTLKELIPQLLEIIDYFKTPISKKYFPAKTLSYLVIRNAWDGVSFLNPQAKNLDFYDDFQHYFVDPVKEYLNRDTEKDKYTCSNCNRTMPKQTYSYGFLNGMGYDLNRKTSNAWNFTNDLYICPICQLLYVTVSAGFTYNMGNRGIFINDDSRIEELIKKNDSVLDEMTIDMENNAYATPYRAFSANFEKAAVTRQKNIMSNIQLISFDNEKYSFQIVPTIASKVFTLISENKLHNGKSILESLYFAGIKGYKEINYYSIFDEVVRRLLNSTGLIDLVHVMELMKLSDPSSCRYNNFHIMAVLQINEEFINQLNLKKGEYSMSIDMGEFSKVRSYGIAIRKGYDNPNKAQTLAYRMLTALKANNHQQFLNLLLNAYMYLGKIVPKEFINNQEDDKAFEEYGYAFVAGLIGNVDELKGEN